MQVELRKDLAATWSVTTCKGVFCACFGVLSACVCVWLCVRTSALNATGRPLLLRAREGCQAGPQLLPVLAAKC